MTQSTQRVAQRIAQCVCGQFKVHIAGEPQLVSSCHCLACQRRTGTLFSSHAFFKREQIAAVEGKHKTFQRRADSGTSVNHEFCPECGTTLYWERANLPGMLTVAVGTLADPDFPPPVRTVWTESKHGWLAFPAGIPHFPQVPD